MPEKKYKHNVIKNLIKGDVFSFDEIFERYNDRVYLFSLKFLRNKEDAEGVVQEVFYSLLKGKDKLKTVENLEAWIFGICFNIIRKHFRQMARDRQHLQRFAELALSDDNSTISEIEYNDLYTQAKDIIERLADTQKKVFMLSWRDGLSNAEISEKLNLTKKTVENNLYRARGFIKKSLIDNGILALIITWVYIK